LHASATLQLLQEGDWGAQASMGAQQDISPTLAFYKRENQIFLPKKAPPDADGPITPHKQLGGSGSAPAPALYVQHLLRAEPPAPHLPREGGGEASPTVPTGVTEKPHALGDSELATELTGARTSPPASRSGYLRAPAPAPQQQPPGCPAPHQPPASPAARSLWHALHFF